VPVYNQEKLIADCLTSILNQSYKNIQVLVIDDGSTDGTVGIIDEFAKEEKCIEVYHLKNRGVSETRNYGIARADGEYIQFVDADDLVRKNMTGLMVRSIEENGSDMSVCNYFKRFGKVYIPDERLDKHGTYKADDYLTGTLKNAGHHYYGVVWNKLYKTQIIRDNGLIFAKDVTLGEDFIFNINYWKCSSSVSVLSDYLYIYSKTNGHSLSNKSCKEINDCMSELMNRKKIFKIYQAAINEINADGHIRAKTYQYWITFYVRQMYGLKHEYTNWSQAERESWRDVINKEPVILESLDIVPKSWIENFEKNYDREFRLKKFCKQILHVR
jgi:glycosyltransferase involved in cell wall biosynthesis